MSGNGRIRRHKKTVDAVCVIESPHPGTLLRPFWAMTDIQRLFTAIRVWSQPLLHDWSGLGRNEKFRENPFLLQLSLRVGYFWREFPFFPVSCCRRDFKGKDVNIRWEGKLRDVFHISKYSTWHLNLLVPTWRFPGSKMAVECTPCCVQLPYLLIKPVPACYWLVGT